MKSSRLISVALVGALFASILALSGSIYTAAKANMRLGELLQARPSTVAIPESPVLPSLDDQIVSVQQKLRAASGGIQTKKVQIRSHANAAIRAIDSSSEASLREAKALMNDIAENSKIILKRNKEIESELLRLSSLYNQKIEKLLAAREAQEESWFGLSFWAGLAGILATLSGTVLAWRQDRLDHRRDLRELVELRHKLAAASHASSD